MMLKLIIVKIKHFVPNIFSIIVYAANDNR